MLTHHQSLSPGRKESMPIGLRGETTEVFTGDSITAYRRSAISDGLGCGDPLHIVGEWRLRHPYRPVPWPDRAHHAAKGVELESDHALDVCPDVVLLRVGTTEMGWQKLDLPGCAISAQAVGASLAGRLAPLLATGMKPHPHRTAPAQSQRCLRGCGHAGRRGSGQAPAGRSQPEDRDRASLLHVSALDASRTQAGQA
jgi:hypothetical protein